MNDEFERRFIAMEQEGIQQEHPRFPDVEMAVLAFYNDHSGTIVWTNDGYVQHEIGELCVGDVFEFLLDKDAPDHGIWVWEGKVSFYGGGYNMDGYEPSEPVYKTICWRHPTDEEWQALKEQRNPFEPKPIEKPPEWGGWNKTVI